MVKSIETQMKQFAYKIYYDYACGKILKDQFAWWDEHNPELTIHHKVSTAFHYCPLQDYISSPKYAKEREANEAVR